MKTVEEISKSQALKAISDAMRNIDDAVHQHPPQTAALYERGMKAIRERQLDTRELEWVQGVGLTAEEWTTVRLYYSAASFMSAWFHLKGDKERRDIAAQSATLLISGVGFDPLEVFKEFMKHELCWLESLSSARVCSSKLGCMITLAFFLLVCTGFWVLFVTS